MFVYFESFPEKILERNVNIPLASSRTTETESGGPELEPRYLFQNNITFFYYWQTGKFQKDKDKGFSAWDLNKWFLNHLLAS